jgi:hypothetical protein
MILLETGDYSCSRSSSCPAARRRKRERIAVIRTIDDSSSGRKSAAGRLDHVLSWITNHSLDSAVRAGAQKRQAAPTTHAIQDSSFVDWSTFGMPAAE